MKSRENSTDSFRNDRHVKTFYGKCNLSSHNHNEKKGSSKKIFFNWCDIRKMLLLSNSHMKEAHDFKMTSTSVQNGLLQFMFNVYQEHIIKQIKKVSFLSIMADDETDISMKTLMILVFWYKLSGHMGSRWAWCR